MKDSVVIVQKRTNQIAAMLAKVHGDDGQIALALLRLRKGSDVRVQALRDIVADELREHRRIAREQPITMQVIGAAV